MRETTLESHQTIKIGATTISYYVREPSPDQWVAVGVLGEPADGPGPYRTTTARRMIVGSGRTRDEAIGDLIARVIVDGTILAPDPGLVPESTDRIGMAV